MADTDRIIFLETDEYKTLKGRVPEPEIDVFFKGLHDKLGRVVKTGGALGLTQKELNYLKAISPHSEITHQLRAAEGQ